MHWALAQNDPERWLADDQTAATAMMSLIQYNDESFKPKLGLYKYAVRFPQYSEAYYREQAEPFLADLNARLSNDGYLLAHMAIFPFIRQFCDVNRDCFYALKYQHLIRWLNDLIGSALFHRVMQKSAD